jgi:hypothetical protein
MGELDPSTPWFEFLSYCECCWSLGVEPSVHRFMRYQSYYNSVVRNQTNDD